MSPWLTILIAVLGSSAIFGFAQFLITRYDKKKDQIGNVFDKVTELGDQLRDLSEKVDNNDAKVIDLIERSHAVEARIRILQASDEMRRSVYHSKEYFDQLHEDITHYEAYCDKHKGFKNNKAVHAIENINRVYQQCLIDNSFL